MEVNPTIKCEFTSSKKRGTSPHNFYSPIYEITFMGRAAKTSSPQLSKTLKSSHINLINYNF